MGAGSATSGGWPRWGPHTARQDDWFEDPVTNTGQCQVRLGILSEKQ